jgi:hypothetical protein
MYAQIFVGLLVWFSLGLAVALVFGAVTAQQDAELRDSALPLGAAFVRVVNAAAPGQSITVKLANFDFGKLDYQDISAYRLVCEGRQVFQVCDKKEQLTIAAGNYYTLTVFGQGEDQLISLIQDEVNSYPDKSCAQKEVRPNFLHPA